jgi:hypothetical protein
MKDFIVTLKPFQINGADTFEEVIDRATAALRSKLQDLHWQPEFTVQGLHSVKEKTSGPQE